MKKLIIADTVHTNHSTNITFKSRSSNYMHRISEEVVLAYDAIYNTISSFKVNSPDIQSISLKLNNYASEDYTFGKYPGKTDILNIELNSIVDLNESTYTWYYRCDMQFNDADNYYVEAFEIQNDGDSTANKVSRAFNNLDSLIRFVSQNCLESLKRMVSNSTINRLYNQSRGLDVPDSVIEDSFENITNYINDRLISEEGYSEEFILVRSKKLQVKSDYATYVLRIKDMEGNQFDVTVEFILDDSGNWTDESNVYDTSEVLNDVYQDYLNLK